MSETTSSTTSTGSIVFGLASYKNKVTGVKLQNLEFGEEASTNEPMDEDGNVNQIDVYGKKLTVQGDGNVLESGSIAVSVGGTLTFDSVEYKITSCRKKYAVNGSVNFSFSGSAPKPASSSGSSTSGSSD